MNEIIKLENINAIELFSNQESLDNLLQEIEVMMKSYVTDVTTSEGRKAIASLAYQVAQVKNELDRLGKEVVAEWKERAKKIDLKRTRAWNFLENLQREIRKPLTEYEDRERSRINQHEKAISEMIVAIQNINLNQIEARIKYLDKIYSERDWEEFSKKAADAYQRALIILNEAKKKDAERKEEFRKQEEVLELKKQEAIKRMEMEKEELEKCLKEEKIKYKQKALKEKEDKEKKLKEIRELTEKRFKEIEATEQEKLEANKKHAAKIHKEIIKALWEEMGMEIGVVEELIKVVKEGKIPHINITY